MVNPPVWSPNIQWHVDALYAKGLTASASSAGESPETRENTLAVCTQSIPRVRRIVLARYARTHRDGWPI